MNQHTKDVPAKRVLFSALKTRNKVKNVKNQMFGYVASSVIQNTNQCQTLSFLGEKLMFDEHEGAQWGTILGPLHCTGNPKTPQE